MIQDGGGGGRKWFEFCKEREGLRESGQRWRGREGGREGGSEREGGREEVRGREGGGRNIKLTTESTVNSKNVHTVYTRHNAVSPKYSTLTSSPCRSC